MNEDLGNQALVEAAKGGSVEAFSELMLQYEKRIYNFLLQWVRSSHDAEDLTQETFLKAFRNIRRLDSARVFSSWLFTIARRTASNHFRALKPKEELPDDTQCGEENPAEALERKEEGDSVWRLARRLKPAQFEVLWLRYGEGFSVQETAHIMNTNQIRVKVLLHRGRKELAQSLQRHRPDLSPVIKEVILPGSEKNRTMLVL